MRRSAAPSFRADIKRGRFIPQVLHNIHHNDKNEDYEKSSILNSTLNISVSNEVSVPNPVDRSEPDGYTNGRIRTNADILDILDDDSSLVNNENITVECTALSKNDNFKLPITVPKPLQVFKRPDFCETSLQVKTDDIGYKTLLNCIFCIKNASEDASLFNVLYCKRSGKKHKTWEGDGLLVIRNRSATLKDLTGKVLDKGIGYKLKDIESLQDGNKFYIGGKECEIQCKIPDEEMLSGKYCKCSPRDEETPPKLKVKAPNFC